jgi:hypothetical protein
VSRLKSWWNNVKDYLKTSTADTWKTVDEMFAQFDREDYNISSSDYSTTKKKCVHAVARLPAPLPLPRHTSPGRCSFFWFFCRDEPIAEEPEDPNACPYKTVEAFWDHIQSQPEYLAWRAAPLEQRASHARQMAKRFHPDKCGAFDFVLFVFSSCFRFRFVCAALAARAGCLTSVLAGGISSTLFVIPITPKNGPKKFPKRSRNRSAVTGIY